MEQVLEVEAQEELSKRSRRSALLMGGAALAGLAFSRAASAQATITDSDILNFALNLEYLEAQFYTLATQGVTIDKISSSPLSLGSSPGTINPTTVTPVPFTTDSMGTLLKGYANETAMDERNHVSFLQTALGSSAVSMPNIDLIAGFNAVATAAGLPAGFNFFASQENFLLGAFIFEDVGVTAYGGAAPLLTSSTNLDKASGIFAVEAFHAAAIRTQIYGLPALGSQYAMYPQYSQNIAAVRALLSGTGPGTSNTTPDDIGVSLNANVTSINGVPVTGGASTIADVDANGLIYTRTPQQVLSIVYGGGAAGVGGAFFPNGMNGTIK